MENAAREQERRRAEEQLRANSEQDRSYRNQFVTLAAAILRFTIERRCQDTDGDFLWADLFFFFSSLENEKRDGFVGKWGADGSVARYWPSGSVLKGAWDDQPVLIDG